jgi:hypothetical protein
MKTKIKIETENQTNSLTIAMETIKATIVKSPSEQREQFDGLTDKVLVDRCASLRPGAIMTPTAAGKHSLRALAPALAAARRRDHHSRRHPRRAHPLLRADTARRVRHRRRHRCRDAHRVR